MIYIYDKYVINNRKPITTLEIAQIDYICNCLIPFFDKLNFRTKKYLDSATKNNIILFLVAESSPSALQTGAIL